MRTPAPLVTALTSLSLAAACGRAPEPNVDPQALARRITSLERRMLEVEEGKSRKPGDATAPGDVRVEVTVEGTFRKVVLRDARGPYPVPGPAPVGDLAVWATFADGDEPAEVGRAMIIEGRPAVIACDAAARTCAMKP
jgi:hypothetical protein